MSRQNHRVVFGIVLAGLIIAAALGALWVFTPGVRRPGYVAGRPLLLLDDKRFTDSQVELQFSPPPAWSMQERSILSPKMQSTERVLVKFKQLIRGSPVAWLRVSVAEAATGQTPAELLRQRKPPELDWKMTKDIEDNLAIGGQVAARITYSGNADPGGRGSRPHICEIVAVRRGSTVFYFAGTFGANDVQEQQLIRAAIASSVFD